MPKGLPTLLTLGYKSSHRSTLSLLSTRCYQPPPSPLSSLKQQHGAGDVTSRLPPLSPLSQTETWSWSHLPPSLFSLSILLKQIPAAAIHSMNHPILHRPYSIFLMLISAAPLHMNRAPQPRVKC
jgi:hypothetical protein